MESVSVDALSFYVDINMCVFFVCDICVIQKKVVIL